MRVSNKDIDRIYINGITRGADYNMSRKSSTSKQAPAAFL